MNGEGIEGMPIGPEPTSMRYSLPSREGGIRKPVHGTGRFSTNEMLHIHELGDIVDSERMKDVKELINGIAYKQDVEIGKGPVQEALLRMELRNPSESMGPVQYALMHMELRAPSVSVRKREVDLIGSTLLERAVADRVGVDFETNRPRYRIRDLTKDWLKELCRYISDAPNPFQQGDYRPGFK